MKDTWQKKLHEKDVEIHHITKDFDDRVEALTVNMTILQAQLPSNKYRMTKKFKVLPGYKVENQFQYPDMLSLSELTIQDLQPLKLGFNQFSVLAQFGQVEQMRVGLEYERKNNKAQCEIHQLSDEHRVAKIEYNWKMYENEESALFFYRFKFYNKEDKVIGTC